MSEDREAKMLLKLEMDASEVKEAKEEVAEGVNAPVRGQGGRPTGYNAGRRAGQAGGGGGMLAPLGRFPGAGGAAGAAGIAGGAALAGVALLMKDAIKDGMRGVTGPLDRLTRSISRKLGVNQIAGKEDAFDAAVKATQSDIGAAGSSASNAQIEKLFWMNLRLARMQKTAEGNVQGVADGVGAGAPLPIRRNR